MALQVNARNDEDDLADENPKIESESTSYANNATFDGDIVLNEYQTTADGTQEDSDIMHTLIEGTNEQVYVHEEQGGQQFLTLSQGNNRIAVNDNGTIVYTNSLADSADEAESRVEEYYEPVQESMEEEYLQENDNVNAGGLDDVEDGTLLLSHGDISGNVKTSNSQFQPMTIAPSTLVSKADNMITIQRGKAFKRSIPSSSKNVVAKVYVQNPGKTAASSTVTGRSMTIAQAQRLGILPSRIQQVLSAGGNSQRIVVKKVVQPSSSNVLIRSPQKILPATTAVRDKITVTGLRPGAKFSQAIRTNVPVSQLKTFLTTTTAPNRAATLNKTFGGMTLQKVDGRTQQVVLRQGGTSSSSPSIKIPAQVGGKQHIQYVKVIGNSGVVTTQKLSSAISKSFISGSSDKKSTDGSRVFINLSDDEAEVKVTPSNKGKQKIVTINPAKKETKNTLTSPRDEENNPDEFDPIDDENAEFGPGSPQRIFEANGIRPKKPCNCTRSQCLKLYCECFANGEFCFECNCNNCFNNIEHEEDRQTSIKSCLERNPDAFRSKIKVADSDDDERRQNNKGCNCKRSHCLKNYCECFETKVLCGKNCKCVSCRNNREDMAAWARGEDFDSGNEERDPTVKSAPFMSQALADALCQCILAQAEASEQKGDDIVTTEQRIIEELGQRLVQIIGNRSKKDIH